MSTDNRTNEPTEAQIEAAAKAIWERYAGHGLWLTLPDARKSPFLKDARAALVAAQEDAPVPSGGVDEDALAEVERAAAEKAWDEGFETAWRLGTVGDVEPTPNPYQEEP